MNTLILGQSTKMAGIMSLFSDKVLMALDNSFYGNRHFQELDCYQLLYSKVNISRIKGVIPKAIEIRNWIKEHDISIIFSQTKYDMLAAKLASLTTNKKIVLLGTSHNSYAWINEKNVKFMSWLVRATTDCYISLASFVSEKLKACGIKENNILLLPNTIEYETWNVKKDYSIGETFKMVYVAYVYPGKQQHLIPEILHKVGKEYNVIVDCYGDDDKHEYINEINSLIERYGMQGKVNLKGCIANTELRAKLADYDAYLCPSKLEMSPVNILEAQAAGLPIISNNTGGIPDLVHDGIDGFLYSNNDTEDASAKIKLLLNDEKLRERFGKASREYVSKEYTPEIASSRIQNKILEIFKNK